MVAEAPAVAQPREVQPVKPEAAATDGVDLLRVEAAGNNSSAKTREEALAMRRSASGDLNDDFEIVDMSSSVPAEQTNEAIDQKARALREALDQKKFGIEILGLGMSDPDVDKIRQILDPLSPAERKAVEKRFQELYDPSRPFDPNNSASSKLRIDLAGKLGAESAPFRQIEALLDRRTGAVNDAGQAMEALAKLATDRVAGEAQLRGVFSTLNAQDSERLQKEFEQKYGKTLDQAMKDAKVSPETVAYVEVFRKGAENRTADDLVKLANLAMDGSLKAREEHLKNLAPSGISADVDGADIKQYKALLKDVLAGSSPAAVAARQKLQEDPNFEKKFAAAFNDGLGRPDKALRDYINASGPSLNTIIEQNMGKTLGFMLNNPDSVTLATQNVSEAERNNYRLGRSLASREYDPTLTAEQTAAIDYYKRTHESLSRGAGSKTWLADSWEANILYGKDNIISKMAATHEDGWTSDSHTADAILTAAESLSEKDWKRLNDEFKANPENGGQFRADIAASLDKYAPEEKERILALLDAKAKAGSYPLSQDIRRGFTDVVADKTTADWLGQQSRDPASIVNGILNLSTTDITRYQKDEAFRKQVDNTVSDSLRGSDQLLAKRLLEKVQNLSAGERLKPDAIDQVLLDKAHDAKPDQILRNIQAAYQQKDASGLTLHERFKSGQPLSEADQALAKVIETQADKAISTGIGVPQNLANSPELRKPVVAEFLETGKLSLNLKSAVGYPLVDLLADVGSATQADLTDLRARLTTEQQKILDAAIAQKDDPKGAVRLEDKLRSFILGDDSKPEQFKEQLAKMTEAEKVELKRAYAAKYGSQEKPADLDKDFLSKVEKARQGEFTNLLSTGAREGRQSFYDNLRSYLDRSGITVDGTETNTERALRQQQDALEQYQRVYQTLPKEKQELLDQYFNDSMEQYKDSKDKLSELAINAAITATALAAAPFTAGMSLQTIAVLSAGGGAFRLAARNAMMGSDFDASGSNVTKELINGAAAMALNFLGAKEIDAVMVSAQKSGAVFGAYLARNGVNEATSRAAAVAAGFSMDVLAGGTIGAATNVGTEILLAPMNGNKVDWDNLWRTAATGFALGAVIPVVIKGVKGGGDTVMNVTRGERGLEWRPENNPQRVLLKNGKVQRVEPGHSVELSNANANELELVETEVVNGKLSVKGGEPLQSQDGHYLDAYGNDLELSSGPTLAGGRGTEVIVEGQVLVPGRVYTIGRSRTSDIAIPLDETVSKRHASIRIDAAGNRYITDLGSTNGTYVNGQRLAPGAERQILPTDEIKFGKRDLDIKERANSEVITARPEARPALAPEYPKATSGIPPRALEQSNNYASRHELRSRIEDGWSSAGARAEFTSDGNFAVPGQRRPSVVVDRANDPYLRAALDEAKARFGSLPPRERAEALTRWAREKLTPAGMSGSQLDAWYVADNAAHDGERFYFGRYLAEGKGVCSQQALLLKLAADEFPDMTATLVRGNWGNPQANNMNHAWTEFDFGDGKPLIYDPRGQRFGQEYATDPRYTPGRDINARLGRPNPVDIPVEDFSPGDQVDYGDQKGWKVRSVDRDSVVIVHPASKNVNVEDVLRWNEGERLIVGQTFKIKRSDGSMDDGWVLTGQSANGSLKFTKADGIIKTVPKDEIIKQSRNGNE